MNLLPKIRPLVLLCLAAPLCLPATARAGDSWDWMVAPYLWATSIDTSLKTTSPPSEGSSESEFNDIVDSLDGAFLIHFEGQGDEWGFQSDFVYLGVADDDERPLLNTRTDLDARLFDAAMVWSPGEQRFTGFEALAGLRYVDLDLTLRLEPVNTAFPAVSVDGGESFSDFLVGARYTWALSERWGMTLRADTSFGDTEGTFGAAGVVQYHTRGGNGSWAFGYRYLDAEFDTGGANSDITLYGPQVGYAFRF